MTNQRTIKDIVNQKFDSISKKIDEINMNKELNNQELLDKILELECRNFEISKDNNRIKIDSFNDHRSISLREALAIYDFINYNVSGTEKSKLREINLNIKQDLKELNYLRKIRNI